MQKWVLVCLLLELLSELKLSEKFNQHFTFLSGLIISAVIIGGILSQFGRNPSFLQDNLENELQKWQKYSQTYEVNENLQEKLAKVEETYERKQQEESISVMQEKFQDILSEGGYEVAGISYDEEEKLIKLQLHKQEAIRQRNIKIDKVDCDQKETEEEHLLQEQIREEITKRMREEGTGCGIEIIFE